MSKTQMSPKFRRASMIGVGIAGAVAIAVPSIAWATDTAPSGDAVVISEVAVTGEQETLTHEEICAQAPVDLDSLTPEELANSTEAVASTPAMVMEEGEVPETSAEDLANSTAAVESTPAISC